MQTFTAFDGHTRISSGDMRAMIAAQRAALPRGVNLAIFDDATGRVRDVDLRDAPPPARGRPKLGVTAREVTLLPRHWDWLAEQKGGASAALRKLVEGAIRDSKCKPDPRKGQTAAYNFLQAIAGDLPGYEEALRKLFAGDLAGFVWQIQNWPTDIVNYAQVLAQYQPANSPS